MATPSTLNPEAASFVPQTPFDPIVTNALLEYFNNLNNDHVSEVQSVSSAPYTSNHARAREAQDEFEWYYGVDASNVFAWQAILRVCGFLAVPSTIDECKRLYYSVHANIFDLVEATRFGLLVKTFCSARDLAVYSVAMKRICPVVVAKEGTLFKAMLRKFG